MPGVHRRSRNCLRRMAQSRRRRAGVGTIGTRPAIKGAQPFDATGLGFIFLPVPATLSFLPGTSTASRHARSATKPLTLGQLHPTARIRLSYPGTPTFLASHESRIVASFGELQALQHGAPAPSCTPNHLTPPVVSHPP